MRSAIVAAIAAATLIGSPAWSLDYTVETFDYPGAISTSVSDVSETGRVAGGYTTAPRVWVGFTEKDGTFTTVGASLPCRSSRRCDTSVDLVNHHGFMAGVFDSDVEWPAVFVQGLGDSAPTPIEAPGYPENEVYLGDLNIRGEVVGTYTNASSPQIYRFYHGTFTTVTLPDPDVTWAQAYGINDFGQISGVYETATGTHGFVLTDGVLTQLEVPVAWNSAETTAGKINNAGVVIGAWYEAVNGYNESRGFKWTDGVFESIVFPGSAETNVSAINNHGEILGTYYLVAQPTGSDLARPFLYKNGQYIDLSTLFPGQFAVSGINDNGQFFGWYAEDPSCVADCVTHGFIATPTTP